MQSKFQDGYLMILVTLTEGRAHGFFWKEVGEPGIGENPRNPFKNVENFFLKKKKDRLLWVVWATAYGPHNKTILQPSYIWRPC